MLRIEHCEFFIEVTKAGSFSKASENLNISQPHLSQSIKQLESIVGVLLFVRSAKGVVLTEEGKKCLVHAKRLLSESETLKDWKTNHPTIRELKIATFNAYAPIDSFYETIKSNEPSLNHQLYEVKNREVVNLVLTRTANLGVMYIENIVFEPFIEALRANSLAFYPLATNSISVVMSTQHPLANRQSVSTQDLIPYPLAFESYKNERKINGHNTLLKDLDKSFYLKSLNAFLNQFSILEMGFENNRSLLYYLSKDQIAFTLGQKRYNTSNPMLKNGELVYLDLLDSPFTLTSGIIYPKDLVFNRAELSFIKTLERAISGK